MAIQLLSSGHFLQVVNMAEISGTRPIAPSPAVSLRANAVTALTLQLAQPLNQLLVDGEKAQAEVINVREQTQQFLLTLRLTLNGGQQTTLQASSPRALEQGTQLNVSAINQQRLSAVVQSTQQQTALNTLDLAQTPIGTQIQGKVISSQALAGQSGYQVVISLLNGAMAGKQLNIQTQLALNPGSLLTAQVQNSQSLSLIPLDSRLNQLAVLSLLSTQQTKQGSLEAALKTLSGLANANLPEGIKTALDKLLSGLPDANQLSSPKGLSQALANSGQFLESRLLGGLAASNDLKANLLRLVSQLQLSLPGVSSALNPASMGQALPALLREVLGRQPSLSFPLPNRMLHHASAEPDLEMLLKLAAAAIARLQTHQLSSLAQSQTGPDGTQLTTWQIEIPMRTQQELTSLQLKVQSEQSPEQAAKPTPEALWRIELAFNLEPLGPLQVQAQLLQGTLSGQLWAERESTATLIEAELEHLRTRLHNGGLIVGELQCHQGLPSQGQRTHIEQRWVDERA